ncbi:MAG: MerR family transcriptional regulator [FCB group bacterium]|nr:MerR family transcriptional regulator [FCB group bacterium]
MSEIFTAGVLAEKAGVNSETIRYYERRHLLPTPQRSPAGYRLYSATDLQRLHFITRAKQHGFSLSEIRELLELKVSPGSKCEDIQSKAVEKIRLIDVKIGELKKIKNALITLVENCSGPAPVDACPVIKAFDEDLPY